jgi:hypothetical protein
MQKFSSPPNCSRKSELMDELKVPIFDRMLKKDCKMILSFKHRKWKRQNYVLVCVIYNR